MTIIIIINKRFIRSLYYKYNPVKECGMVFNIIFIRDFNMEVRISIKFVRFAQ